VLSRCRVGDVEVWVSVCQGSRPDTRSLAVRRPVEAIKAALRTLRVTVDIGEATVHTGCAGARPVACWESPWSKRNPRRLRPASPAMWEAHLEIAQKQQCTIDLLLSRCWYTARWCVRSGQ